MGWKESVFRDFRLYAVTDLREATNEMFGKIEAAYKGGADIVQLRSHCLPDAELLRAGKIIKKISRKYRRLFFVNDRVDLAVLLQADGVHLGQEDMPLADARKIAKRTGSGFWFGKSTHNLDQARAAVRDGADYIGIGPVFSTPTKPGRKPVGLNLVSLVARSIRIPFVAIGGIDPTNLRSVLNAGASRAAVVRAIFDSRDPEKATRQIRSILNER